MALSAILWDYDGTLVDSTKKNMAVTVEVLQNFIPDIQQHLPLVLTDAEEYRRANHKFKDWREMYRECYNLSESQIDKAGDLWSTFQLKNRLTPELFPGLGELFKIVRGVKQGICSRNCAISIRKTLKKLGLSPYFEVIVGYEEVPWTEQKPNPAGFIKCLNMLNVSLNNTTVFYIGDHQEDVVFGKNAKDLLNDGGHQVEVKCIAVDYSGSKPSDWISKPDFVASSPEDIHTIINGFRHPTDY